MSNISLSQLLEAGVHFGHKAHRWNPKMFPYIYSEVNNIHILDLIQSATLLKEANTYLESTASEGKTFLFVGTKRQASTLIAQEAKRCDSYYVNHRWLGGMLTNWTTVTQRIGRLKDLEKLIIDDNTDIRNIINDLIVDAGYKTRLAANYNQALSEIDKKLPDVAIIIDQKREMTAIAECRKLGITVVSILDTNCDPDLVDIPIPGNDDAVRSIKLILNSLTDSIIQGQLKSK